MQTFLPFPDFRQSQDLLCRLRLNKQNIESTQILNILLGRISSKAWSRHPATLLWKGYENALKLYKNIGMELGTQRGIKYVKLQPELIDGDIVMPPIIGRADFHRSHLANLKRKALLDLEKKRGSLMDRMVSALGLEEFNSIDETLPYVWS